MALHFLMYKLRLRDVMMCPRSYTGKQAELELTPSELLHIVTEIQISKKQNGPFMIRHG